MKYKNSAFTLIELLVVVLIIGILTSVAIPQYQRAVEKARLAEALANLNTLRQAVDVYILENGYPSNSDDGIKSRLSVSVPDKTKFFLYTLFGYRDSIKIFAFRLGPSGDYHDGAYAIMWIKSNDQWTFHCGLGSVNQDMGSYICSSLNSQYATGS